MTKEEKLKQAALDKYIKDKHTQEECVGFIDGFEAAREYWQSVFESGKKNCNHIFRKIYYDDEYQGNKCKCGEWEDLT